MRSLLIALTFVAHPLCSPAVAQDLPTLEQIEAELDSRRRDRFNLFTNCAPISVWSVLGYDAESAQEMAETRLEVAGLLYDGAFTFDGSYLSIAPSGFPMSSWTLNFGKMLDDPLTGATFRAVTWQQSFPYGTGAEISRTERSRQVMADLSRALDTFILQYLQVNGDSCR